MSFTPGGFVMAVLFWAFLMQAVWASDVQTYQIYPLRDGQILRGQGSEIKKSFVKVISRAGNAYLVQFPADLIRSYLERGTVVHAEIVFPSRAQHGSMRGQSSLSLADIQSPNARISIPIPRRGRDALRFDVTSSIADLSRQSMIYFLTVEGPVPTARVYLSSMRAGIENMPYVELTLDQAGYAPASIGVTANRKSFENGRTGEAFKPLGVNYANDQDGMLLEDYWDREWSRVEQDFIEMKALSFNTIRLHLEFGRFMTGPSQINEKAFKNLDRVVQLSERLGLKLDLTGLAFYQKATNPNWYLALDDQAMFDQQAYFWTEVASRYRSSSAIFCYDIQNEPFMHTSDSSEIVGAEFFNTGMHYTQGQYRDISSWWSHWVSTGGARNYQTFLNAMARSWVERMVDTIRAEDPSHLITLGLAEETPYFTPENLNGLLDFYSFHQYPTVNKSYSNVSILLRHLQHAQQYGPVILEEVSSLAAGTEETLAFLDRSAEQGVAGWLSFYTGATAAELRAMGGLTPAIQAYWLDHYVAWLRTQAANL